MAEALSLEGSIFRFRINKSMDLQEYRRKLFCILPKLAVLYCI